MATRVTAPENREDKIREQARRALDALRSDHAAAQQIIDGNATTLLQANTALDMLAEQNQRLQRLVGKLIRLEIEQLDDTEL